MPHARLIALAAAATLAACAGDSTAPAPETPRSVVVFTNRTYVDYDEADYQSDGGNLVNAIRALGHSIGRVEALEDTAWTRATQAKVVVLPELSRTAPNLYGATSAAQHAILTGFVSAGGTLVSTQSTANLAFIKALFNITITGPFTLPMEESTVTAISTDATGTSFAGGPGTLPSNVFTNGVALEGLPANALTIYRTSGAQQSTVTVLPIGQGQVILLGWNWYDSTPVGRQDNGWNDVLDRAIRFTPDGA